MTDSIIVFAKAPVLGMVKTRLVKSSNKPYISEYEALNIHTAFLADTLRLASRVNVVKRYLYYTLEEGLDIIAALAEQFGFHLFRQHGNDLGERMYNALNEVLKKGIDKAIIIGSDTPTLPEDYINNAISILDKKDVVVGPSSDGGYYLVGMKGDAVNIFKDIDWGTSRVFSQTKLEIKKSRIKAEFLPLWYDIDTIDDLIRLMDHLDNIRSEGIEVPIDTYNRLRNLII